MSDSEGPAPTSAPSSLPNGSTTKQHVCVCTPSGHVPRPRNAFILYRQHHHSKVVAENPGKTNPEISKIIGEKWRSLSQEDKEVWIQMGDEEKKSHLMRFPDYRYQPRRSSKKGASSGGGTSGGNNGVAAVTGPTTCSVCKGITPAGLQHQQQQQQQQHQQQQQQQLHYPGSAASSPTPTTPTSPVPHPRAMSATSSPYGSHGEMYYRPPGSVPYYYPAPPSPTAPGAYPPYYRYALPMTSQPSSAQSPVPQFPPEPHSRQPSPLPGTDTSGTYPEHYNESRSSTSTTYSSAYTSGGCVSSNSSVSRSGSTSSMRTSISSGNFEDTRNANYQKDDAYAQSLRSPVSTPPLSDLRNKTGVHSPTSSYSNQPWPFYQPSPAATTPGSPGPGSPAGGNQKPLPSITSSTNMNTTTTTTSHPYPSIPALQSDEYPHKKRRTSSYHDPLGGPGGIRGEISRYNTSSAYSMSSSGMQSPFSSHSPTPAPVPAPPPPPPAHNPGNELTAREKADILSMMCEPVKSVSRLIAIEGTDKALIKRITEKLSEKLDDSGASGIYCSDLVRRRPAGLSTEFASNLWTLACMHQLVSDSKSKYVLMGGYLMDIADDVAAAHRSTTWAYRDRWVNGINLLQGLRGPDYLVYLQESGPTAQGEVTVAELKGGMKMLIIMPGREEQLVDKIYEVVR